MQAVAFALAVALAVVPPVPDESPQQEYLGVQTISAYCYGEDGGDITAMGTTPRPWQTVATTSEIPLGTVLYIEGVGEVVVEDRGGALIESGQRIDLYVDGNPEAWGLQERKVWKIER